MRISDWSSDVCSSDLGSDRDEKRQCDPADERQREQGGGDGGRPWAVERRGSCRRCGACPNDVGGLLSRRYGPAGKAANARKRPILPGTGRGTPEGGGGRADEGRGGEGGVSRGRVRGS